MRNIDDLRERLFSTLDAVLDGSMEIERAKAVNEVATVIIQSAKVEVDYVKATGASGASTDFLAAPKPEPKPIPQIQRGIAGVAAQLKEIRQ